MELSTRKVEITGMASSPSGLWMNHVGRNLTDAVDGLLNGERYLIPSLSMAAKAKCIEGNVSAGC